MLHWCLNVFEKIVIKHLHKSLKIHTSRRRRLKESICRKRPQFWQGDDWYLIYDNATAHRSPLGRRFVSSNEVKGALQEALREIAKTGFQKLYERCQKCTVIQGDYLKGGCASVL
ncbi:hypothetical protein TNCV_829071 [Trichonephila clavipes]|nr:hypothetical protein TNCV_829071 [Trichonephila clavipes]